ncbi:cryptochrome/photolyase family protein [Ponticoccus sp. SC2-23]|uniref:cryptochrome/photolyase family protein n=1 Tax=Alexandriicola marinus TaxID=2081710 RepID=UPI000FD86D0D|nr:cryptochrome/photolyase family protein [Alexandriicola marinus]MBM1219723.1 cryptochrome/photolyase family protein [Ponticoccus sp. SC6-9]MBM1223205.1 cryptochrome/photolyase family protein [Ponticoccus sp. SC6-15]MBM1229536.1 cryptochrome/photolyase family protein [Ponticoccus sp. SC6-38]MBM1232171.1 cryptochrome/photolyase family protein [Ponticoccus sp. SC6-45]MBM1237879.1 cryptochrome/photolyase family protein [Ponticoccus sp. SC6-49]MBM1241182.1 cryptochrome/photolyase family protein 
MVRLVLVLGDQLTPDIAALAEADRASDVVVMAEVASEAGYVPHHPKKIAFVFAAMRKFAAGLEQDGWRVAYTRLDDPDNAGSIPGEILRRAEEFGAGEVLATEPGEWRLISALEDMPLPVHLFEDRRFIATHAEFEAWAEGRKALRMEYFYREMRRKTGLLMEDGAPSGGKWNYDAENRKPAPDEVTASGPMEFTPDAEVDAVLDLVEARFGDNFGTLRPFWFATDRGQARRHLAHWVKTGLPGFGDFQDAMVRDEPFLWHAVLGLYLNAGLLDPLEVCRAAQDAWEAGEAPLNAVEGFIRQIIGWREYVRGIYFLEGPDYTRRNALGHDRPLPAMFWGAETGMECIRQTVAQTEAHAYAHHIQRLMVTGNFGLLAGIDPHALHEWYLAVYADAYEWVEAPNVIGMSQFADAGVIASKPYVSSGNYIAKMSDYCGDCRYKVRDKTGPDACPFNLLYWHFLDRHRDRFEGNPRLGNIYRTWDRMDEAKRETVLSEARAFLDRLDEGAAV